jgi:hypothetical protein
LPTQSGFEAGLARFSKAFAQKSVQITIWIEHPTTLSNRLAANPPPNRKWRQIAFNALVKEAGWRWTTSGVCDILAGWKSHRYFNRFLPLPGKRNAESGLPFWQSL